MVAAVCAGVPSCAQGAAIIPSRLFSKYTQNISVLIQPVASCSLACCNPNFEWRALLS